MVQFSNNQGSVSSTKSAFSTQNQTLLISVISLKNNLVKIEKIV
jgi:hypothetical protein